MDEAFYRELMWAAAGLGYVLISILVGLAVIVLSGFVYVGVTVIVVMMIPLLLWHVIRR